MLESLMNVAKELIYLFISVAETLIKSPSVNAETIFASR